MRTEQQVSRRQALGITGAAAAGLFMAGCSKEADITPAAPEKFKMTVYDPTGSIRITQLFSPRLDTLEGKTIAFVADDAWEDARTSALIQKILKEKYPSVTIITADNFTRGISNITKDKNGIPEKMQELGVDAAIIGNAG